jgi:hypothetical protein
MGWVSEAEPHPTAFIVDFEKADQYLIGLFYYL